MKYALPVFENKKDLHIRVDRKAHAFVKSKLMHTGVSLQELFDEIATKLATDEMFMNKIVNSIVARKMKTMLQVETPERKRMINVGSLEHSDTEMLYDLINQETDIEE